ncbi:MAG: bifunctional serine/threonine-protein kinase/universal stress protein [Ancalomicrobiaceae bacterium]|nr:bifunctional serine/threonine-protein kinase/universal stress protein [Ancalomicrobiaceae bacterium]
MSERKILAPGLMIDGFTLGERIFAGGMGSVWRATHPDHTLPIIVKIPFFAPGENVSAIIAFEIEEMIMKRLSGPHVPKFLGSGELADLPYIAMEFVEGDLLSTLTDAAPIPAAEVVRVGQLLARALIDIHRQQVVHLDLKPGNVILSKRGAVLIDFGLAHHDKLPDLMGEETALPVGSAPYMSPEQILGDRTHLESDIYAVGAMLYELATAKPPFGIPNTRSGLKQRLKTPPAMLAPALSGVPPGLAEVILKSLSVDPADRYPTADHLLFDLNHLDQVALTDRSQRNSGGFLARIGALLSRPSEARRATPRPTSFEQRFASAPVIMAAVDLSHGADPLAELVRVHVRRVLAAEPRARLACVTVLKTKIIGEDKPIDEAGRPAYIGRLVALKDWARSLHLPEEKVSYHVLEGVDAAASLMEYANHNPIDHIVMGARASSSLRRHLGSVSSRVVAEARSTVTVVRLGGVGETDEPPPGPESVPDES